MNSTSITESKKAANLCDVRLSAALKAFVQNAQRWGFSSAIGRAERAAQIVETGGVKRPRPLNAALSFVGEMARVKSQSEEGKYYAVIYQPPAKGQFSGYFCTCPDCSWGIKRTCLPADNPARPPRGAPYIPGFGYACKHAIAAHLAKEAGLELGSEPIPFKGEPFPYSDAAGYDEEFFEMLEMEL